MGVPRFFRWISERYPLLNSEVRDDTMPEIDNLYLDMNGIIHRCTHGDREIGTFSEERVMVAIFQYIDRLFEIVRPRKIFFMAIDGVAPRAKMNQQRQRRHKSALDLVLRREEQMAGRDPDGDNSDLDPLFDSNCITPGTEFMARLTRFLDYFIRKKISEDRDWQRCHIILSGHEFPGEGEHKIMDFIRHRKNQPNYASDERHCLYGLDADLIMLSLASHEPHFVLLREEITFGNKPQKPLKGRTEEELKHEIRDETRFHLLYVNLLREYIELEFEDVVLPFAFDLENIIDDFILLCYFMGNDFLPSLPTFNIGEGSLNDLFDIYRDELPNLGGYLTYGATVHWGRVQQFLALCVDSETEALRDMARDLSWINGSVTTVSFDRVDEVRKALAEQAKEEGSSDKPSVPIDDEDQLIVAAAMLDDLDLSSSAPVDLGSLPQLTAADRTEWKQVHKRQKKSPPTPDELREMFYKAKFGPTDTAEQIVRDYIEGVQWNLRYYFEGVCSWSWFYPHHHAPFVRDLARANLAAIGASIKFDKSQPFKPFMQLMGVLPAASSQLVPAPLAELMTNPSSVLSDYYPRRFDVDRDPRKPEWEAIVLIPFVEQERLKAAVEAVPSSAFSKAELERNKLGPTYRYVFDPQVSLPVPSPAPAILPDLKNAPAAVYVLEVQPTPGFVPRVPEGCHLGLDAPAGFPSLRSLQVAGRLDKVGVNVFGATSRKVSLLLSLEDHAANAADIARLLTVPAASIPNSTNAGNNPAAVAFKHVFVDYPVFTEAEVKFVSDRDVTYTVEKGQVCVRKHGQEDLDWFDRTVTASTTNQRTRRAIDIGTTYVILTVRRFEGMVRDLTGRTVKVFRDEEFPVPLQLLLHDRVPRLSPRMTAATAAQPLQEQFPVGADVVFLGDEYFGAIGRVVGLDMRFRRLALELHVREQVTLDGGDEAGAFKAVLQQERWVEPRVIQKELGIGPRALSQLTSSFIVALPDGGPACELGLGIKLAKKDLHVSGWARRLGSEAEGNVYWEYSDLTRRKLLEYKQRCPQLFAALSNEALFGGAAKGKLTLFDLFPVPPSADPALPLSPEAVALHIKQAREVLEAAHAWLQEFRKSNLMLVSASTERLSYDNIENVLQLAAELARRRAEKPWMRVLLQNVSPVLVYASGDHSVHGTGARLRSSFKLGDRVVSTRNSGAVPFGLTGTIVEIGEQSADVVFDEEFLLARSVQQKGTEKQSRTISLAHLLNLSRRVVRESRQPFHLVSMVPCEPDQWLVTHVTNPALHAPAVAPSQGQRSQGKAKGQSYALGPLVRDKPEQEHVKTGRPASVRPAKVPERQPTVQPYVQLVAQPAATASAASAESKPKRQAPKKSDQGESATTAAAVVAAGPSAVPQREARGERAGPKGKGKDNKGDNGKERAEGRRTSHTHAKSAPEEMSHNLTSVPMTEEQLLASLQQAPSANAGASSAAAPVEPVGPSSFASIASGDKASDAHINLFMP